MPNTSSAVAAGVGDQHPADRIGGQRGGAFTGAQRVFGLRAAGVDGGHRGLAAVQHHSRISLGDKRIDAREDLQLRSHRGVGAQRVHRAVGAAEHQLAVGAAGDRGEVGVALTVDLHPGDQAVRDVDPEIPAARRRVHVATVVAGHRRRRPGQRHGAGQALRGHRGDHRLVGLSGAEHHQRCGRGVEHARTLRDRPVGRTTPAGGRVTGGDVAAWAGAIVGGGASAGFDEHATRQQAIARKHTTICKLTCMFDTSPAMGNFRNVRSGWQSNSKCRHAARNGTVRS